ncbi:SDR family NAD(P)-dependent oxidoreductase [Pseudorhodoplanes sinuspersici]|uniref:Short-chain dehydrogenase n=1 Tax=Pseudorhodoplanes sinuspersici TaxID=1235591 RepID=A0A1W6ZJQ3_9HYPH|nr:SDR family oxidoreductase [Pseudorhodoplanes sinuspersici]ARP97653.1 short-chain dehydrogenase [Pseudorhodoplanes sinuspersici]RKE65678.1 3-oxoacyl-[acyl-carrier protein] reductase [Pseudorhodoplanes sinuspersici]
MTGIDIPALQFPKVALVTGGSSGIGKATAARLAAMGSAVVVGYNSGSARAQEVVDGLQVAGRQDPPHCAMRIAIDETDSIAEAAAAVEKLYGRLDALINCGGATTPVPLNDLDKLTDAIFDKTVTINLRGPFAMMRAFRPLLEHGTAPAIINISSIAARTGLGSSLAYLAAKAGVDALTVALAKILAPKIRVFSVSPAGVDTDFVPGRSREQLQKTAEKLPLAHITTPDDVARAVVACIVHLTSSTGIVVPVDEGRHL